MKVCFVGTCQAMALYSMYNQYIQQDGDPPADYISSNLPMNARVSEIVTRADVVVSQVFSSEQRLSLSRADVSGSFIEFPYISGLFLWPFATEAHIHRRFIDSVGFAPYDEELGDAYLNRMIAQGIDADQCLNRYREESIQWTARAERRAELLFDQQQKRDARTGIPALDFVKSRISQQQLFLTRGHLSKPTLLFLAEQVFGHLGVKMSQIAGLDCQMYRIPDHRNFAPIHPAIGRLFGLSYVTDDCLYEQFYGNYKFGDCVVRYVNYEWNQQLVEGLKLENSNEHRKAISKLQDAEQSGIVSAWTHFARGRSYGHLGRHDEAIIELEQALAQGLAEPHVYTALAAELRSEGRHSDACTVLERAIALFPCVPEAWDAISHAHSAMGDIARALVCATKAVDLAVKVGRYLHHLASLKLRAGLFREAILDLERSLELNGINSGDCQALSTAYSELGDFTSAERFAKEAAALRPDDIGLLYQLAMVQKNYDIQGARATYELITGRDQQARHAWQELSHLELKIGNLDRSIIAAERFVALCDDDMFMLKHLSSVYGLSGRVSEALDCRLRMVTLGDVTVANHLEIASLADRLEMPYLAIYARAVANTANRS